MRWIAVIFLAVFGLIELLIRACIFLLLAITIIGLLALVDESHGVERFFRPFLWDSMEEAIRHG